MTPDHEAAKKFCENVLTHGSGFMHAERENAARAYLDLVAQLEQLKADKQRAVELLREIAKAPVLSDYELTKQVCAFLAERGEG